MSEKPDADESPDTDEAPNTGEAPDAGEKTATFVVTHADEGSAVVRDVASAQVHALSSNPGVDERDVLEATIAPDPPLEVSWQVVEVADRHGVEVVDSDIEPTRQSLDAAADAATGELTTFERAGSGEVHVLSVDPSTVETAVADVLDDPETVVRAARLGATRVEVRRARDDGVLSVRYLPD